MKSVLLQLCVACCAFVAAAETNTPSIIPLPQEMTVQKGVYHLGPETKILVDSDSKDTGNFLAMRLRTGTGYPMKVAKGLISTGGSILLSTHCAGTNLGAEGYRLFVASNHIAICAPTQAGLFYGVQTLLQLLPPEILADKPATNQPWTIPCVTITDQPRFAWRGLMLDVSRHFYTKAEVEKILDSMALYKLNTFHFHLVDDPGWRIEIKKYPRLTSVGAWRNGIDFGLDPKSSTAYRADGKYGGFYTQKDIKVLVAYAAERHITIVPEIEMPGHSAGALAPYPQYSCTGGPFSLDGDDAIFCPGNEQTFTFLENILSEVFKMFPGQFIHVGGDEVSTHDWKKCPKCQARMKAEGLRDPRQLEGYLLQRIEKFVNAHGKRLIGWSEIREAGLPKNAAVMDWIGGATEAARAGHDVVLSPASPVDFAYLDHYQSENHATEPVAIGGFLPLRQVYRFEPVPKKLAPQFQSHILGGQGNLWTEYIPNLRHAEYMIFPRECAMAEALWSPQDSRNWDDFLARVKINERRLDALGVNYRRNPTQTGEKKQ
jgi:hexosaminidase